MFELLLYLDYLGDILGSFCFDIVEVKVYAKLFKLVESNQC